MQNKWHNTKQTIRNACLTQTSVFIGHVPDYGDLGGFFLDTWKASDPRNNSRNAEDKLDPCPQRPFKNWFKFNFHCDVDPEHLPMVTMCGIFAVERKHIHQRSRDSYLSLCEYVDHHSNPEAGHYIERSWLRIFGPIPTKCQYR